MSISPQWKEVKKMLIDDTPFCSWGTGLSGSPKHIIHEKNFGFDLAYSKPE